MINRFLMELYDEYEKGNVEPLKEFTKKTLPSDGTDIFFIGCVLILFSRNSGFKERYYCTREGLLDIVKAAKIKKNGSNLLTFYVENVNTVKGIRKYFNEIDENNFDQYADLVIDYLEQFRPSFI